MENAVQGAPAARVPVKEKFAYGLRAFSQQMGSNGITMFAFPEKGEKVSVSTPDHF